MDFKFTFIGPVGRTLLRVQHTLYWTSARRCLTFGQHTRSNDNGLRHGTSMFLQLLVVLSVLSNKSSDLINLRVRFRTSFLGHSRSMRASTKGCGPTATVTKWTRRHCDMKEQAGGSVHEPWPHISASEAMGRFGALLDAHVIMHCLVADDSTRSKTRFCQSGDLAGLCALAEHSTVVLH